MAKCLIKPSLFIIFIIYVIIINGQSSKPNFRILAPQFICSSDKLKENITALPEPSPGATTIRLQTASGQELSYNWTVRFNVLNGPRSQRFNLLVWRAVRNLERTLTNLSPEIASTNIVVINNTMLVEGVDYVFYISGINKQGIVGDMKSFAIKFQDVDSEPQFDISGEGVNEQFSVLMLGSDVMYVDVPYVVEAHVTPCKPTHDYYFVWTVTDLLYNTVVNVNQQNGKRLNIAPGKLIGGREYDIHCNISRISDNNFITSKGIFIITKVRGISVDMNVKELKVAASSSINLIGMLKNPDNIPGYLSIEWRCKVRPTLKDCDNFKSFNQSELILEGGLENDGEYEFEVIIIKGNESASQKCKIIVQNAMIPTIEFDKASILAISGQPLEIQARVSDLRSGCNLQWISVEENGFTHFDKGIVPGNFGNLLPINSIDETFLSEIVEFGNETIYKNFPLLIPGKSETWLGLKPNVKYKFRLLVECICSMSIECDGPQNVTAYSDLVVETNEPPIPKSLNIKPAFGMALMTVFQLRTSAASDIPIDYPLTYTFGYKLTTSDINIIKIFVENLVVETILPFSNSPLIPTLKVCDSRSACSDIDGEPINIQKPIALTMDKLRLFIDTFQVNLYRKEYFDGFKLISMVLQTLQAMDENELNKLFMIEIENLIKVDIYKQIENIANESNIAISNEFILIVTKFIEKFTISDSLLQDILKLRDNVFEVVSQTLKTVKVKQSQKLIRSNDSFKVYRKRRYKRDLSSDDIQSLLKVSEYVILTSKNEEKIKVEKENFLSKLQISIRELCKTKEKHSTIIESELVSMSVERIILKPHSIFYIPYNPNTSSKINNSVISDMQILPKDDFLSSNSYCLARSLYSVKLFENDIQQNGWIYQSSMYDNDLVELKNNFQILLKIPVLEPLLQINGVLQCRKWNGNDWDETTCESNDKYIVSKKNRYVICKCDSFGIFSLYASPKIVTTTHMSLTENTDFSNEVISTISENSIGGVTEIFFDTTESLLTTNAPLKYKTDKWNGNKILFSSLISIFIIGIMLILIFICFKRRKNQKKAAKIIPANAVVASYEIPKYRKFHAEHLMEGSAESLGALLHMNGVTVKRY